MSFELRGSLQPNLHSLLCLLHYEAKWHVFFIIYIAKTTNLDIGELNSSTFDNTYWLYLHIMLIFPTSFGSCTRLTSMTHELLKWEIEWSNQLYPMQINSWAHAIFCWGNITATAKQGVKSLEHSTSRSSSITPAWYLFPKRILFICY